MSRAGYGTSRYRINGTVRGREWVLRNAALTVSKIASVAPGCVTLATISSAASDAFRLTVDDISGESLWFVDVSARQIAMTLAYLITSHSLVEIASYFNRSDHAVILHSYHKYGAEVSEMCRTNDLKVQQRIPGRRLYSVLGGKRPYRVGGPHSRIWKKMRVAEALEAVASWKEYPAYSDDIFPGAKPQSRVNRLTRLRNLGYVTSSKSHSADETMLWQITDAGLVALEGLRPLLQIKPQVKEAA